jgi:hypothetical protein
MSAHGIMAHVDLQAACTPIAKTFYMRTHSILAFERGGKGWTCTQHNLGFGFRVWDLRTSTSAPVPRTRSNWYDQLDFRCSSCRTSKSAKSAGCLLCPLLYLRQHTPCARPALALTQMSNGSGPHTTRDHTTRDRRQVPWWGCLEDVPVNGTGGEGARC